MVNSAIAFMRRHLTLGRGDRAGATRLALLPASTFSNLPVHASGAVNAITVVLVDGPNTPFADQAYARRQLIKVLGALTPADRVARYALGHGLRILHDFTDDASSLLRALERRGLYTGPKLDDSNPAAATTPDEDLTEFLDHANRAVADFQVADRVTTTLDAITAIAQHVAGLPGRKNLVWISGGFPFAIGMDAWSPNESRDSRTFANEMERAARAVTAAQLAIYLVDARGLTAGSTTGAGATGGRATSLAGLEAMRDVQQTQDVMDILAARTGGKSYVNSNYLRNHSRAVGSARTKSSSMVATFCWPVVLGCVPSVALSSEHAHVRPSLRGRTPSAQRYGPHATHGAWPDR